MAAAGLSDSWNLDIFIWISLGWKKSELPVGPAKVGAEVESIHILGANNQKGPYTAIIAAGGGEVEANHAYGAAYYGEEVVDYFSGETEREPIRLMEGGHRQYLGGLYWGGEHSSTKDTGMYFGVRAGPVAVGIGGNLQAGFVGSLAGVIAPGLMVPAVVYAVVYRW
jgi:hypothetical protein